MREEAGESHFLAVSSAWRRHCAEGHGSCDGCHRLDGGRRLPDPPDIAAAPTSVPVAASLLVGVYEPGVPGSWSNIAEFTTATGVKPGIVVYYSPWNDPFSTSFAQTARAHDAYVLVQLQPNGVTLASIAAGGSDAYLRSYADAVVAFGHPVILSFGHEMNGTWYSWGYGHASPGTFAAAWRHVVRVFRAEGAATSPGCGRSTPSKAPQAT